MEKETRPSDASFMYAWQILSLDDAREKIIDERVDE